MALVSLSKKQYTSRPRRRGKRASEMRFASSGSLPPAHAAMRRAQSSSTVSA